MNPTTTILSTLESFKRNRSRFYLMPLESTISLPIPLLLTTDGRVFLAFLVFTGKKMHGEAKIRLFRPHTKIVIEYSSAKIAFYQDYTVFDEFPTKDWNQPIGEFPHEMIQSLTLKEYTEKRKDLLGRYDPIIPLFVKNESDKELVAGFKRCFNEICEPDLLPFMRKVGKFFFKWLD
jgi:hypothetical protein